MKMIKFMYNGIKVDGVLYKASYSKGNYRPESGLLEADITIYGKRYKELPDIGVKIENNSDFQSDYFENDKIRVTEHCPIYGQVLDAWKKQEEKAKAQNEKRRARNQILSDMCGTSARSARLDMGISA